MKPTSQTGPTNVRQQIERLDGCLQFDLETTVLGTRGPEPGEAPRILALGAALGPESLLYAHNFSLEQALDRLADFSRRATWVLGHNLLGHDLEILRSIAPGHPILALPAVDTLYLSPLAFPENPYHRLVKDYKLNRQSRNDPLADARLAARLFKDQWRSLEQQAHREPGLLAFYASCFFAHSSLNSRGLAWALAAVGENGSMTAGEALDFFRRVAGPQACTTALGALESPARPAWAYTLAWLRIAGGHSVLPSWVRLRFPEVPTLLDALREKPCEDNTCTYCLQSHDPQAHLRRFFGFEDFRPEPAAPDGSSLQRAVVNEGLAGRPLLTILATGAGKSICYQLPALVRFQRRGLLTLVISPLQALMKDQVDHLNAATGSESAAALYGLLTPPERGRVLERVRLGDVALLYIAPEQLRNRSFRRVVAQREIGCWVFDEAHCLSKWGHDFRPDYLYAARFVLQLSQEQSMAIPPVACFTATAKEEVQREILTHFREVLGQDLKVFESSIEREELRFLVESVPGPRKLERTYELLADTLSVQGGAVVVYCASRRGTVQAAEYFKTRGMLVAAFHAGLPKPEKRQILDDFVSGALPVVCATNAFGMGIDKSDVRLVVHLDIPASLESYLQEAGRAGRDRRRSDCILLFDENDLEKQFRLLSGSRLTQRDLAELLRGLRRARRQRGAPDQVTLTSAELLRDEAVVTDFQRDDWQADTKVKTAISWLERAGFVERLDNQTRIFQGRLLVESVAEARQRLKGLGLTQTQTRRWLTIVAALLRAQPDDGLSADEIAELPGVLEEANMPGRARESPGQNVLRTLQSMVEAGLLKDGLRLTAHVHFGGPRSSRAAFQALGRLDRALLELLRESEPDAESGAWLELSLRLVNQRLLDRGFECNPAILRKLIRCWAEDGKLEGSGGGSVELRLRSKHRYRMRCLRPWKDLETLSTERWAVGKILLDRLLTIGSGDAEPQPRGRPLQEPRGRRPQKPRGRRPQGPRGRQLVAFGLDDLTDALRRDLAVFSHRASVPDLLRSAERGLLLLHELGILQLDQGLAVFRQAMSIRIRPEATGRGYRSRDYKPLEQHYGERIFQVHVMGRYAHLGLEAIQQAVDFVGDYFRLGKASFVERHFGEDVALLERATGEASYQQIVEALGHRVQIEAVSAPVHQNQLVLAGPGSGKTRVVVHRCAYLLRMERVPARSLVVLCFNRNAALEVRRRLQGLVGEDAKGVTVQTFHGLAMRLTGTSFVTLAEREVTTTKAPDFKGLITQAVRLLRGEESLPGMSAEDLLEEACAGFSHLLVDEYQDIDPNQYELISALAGRGAGEGERRLTVLAVGDDDQNIYAWTGADVRFIHRFRVDYGAQVHTLTTCYRATGHILAAAQGLIEHNPDRLKQGQDLSARSVEDQGPGGPWAEKEEGSGGRVRILQTSHPRMQAMALAERLREMARLDPELCYSDCAVLARLHDVLHPIRTALESLGIPVAWAGSRESLPPLYRIREIRRFLDVVQGWGREPRRASQFEEELDSMSGTSHLWWSLLEELLAEWRQESADAEVSSRLVADWLFERLVERSREPVFGEGVRLMTVHAAKGLEFEHVFVPDGGWQVRPPSASSPDPLADGRRLFYVAMTRARHTLQLGEVQGGRNPHLSLLSGEAVERVQATSEPLAESLYLRRYSTLTLADLYLSHAGKKASDHPIHEHLQRLQPGSALALQRRGHFLSLVDASGEEVAALSTAARDFWTSRLGLVESVRVLALVERRSTDSEPNWREQHQVPVWEVPVVEIVHREP